MTAFEIATQHRNEIQVRLDQAIADLNAITDKLAGNAPRPMGLTPDHVKANATWRAAKHKADMLFMLCVIDTSNLQRLHLNHEFVRFLVPGGEQIVSPHDKDKTDEGPLVGDEMGHKDPAAHQGREPFR